MRHYACPLCIREYDMPGYCLSCEAPLVLAPQRIDRHRPQQDPEPPVPPPPRRRSALAVPLVAAAVLILGLGALVLMPGGGKSSPATPRPVVREKCPACGGRGSIETSKIVNLVCESCAVEPSSVCQLCRGRARYQDTQVSAAVCWSCRGSGLVIRK